MVRLPVANDAVHGAAACRVWGMGPNELATAVPGHSATALFGALHRPWRWSGAGPALSPRIAARLEGFRLPPVRARQRSADGSTKLLLDVGDGSIECVHMPRNVARGRVTLCVSSQVGCAMGCTFCATAEMGLRRQLSAGEMVAQVLVALSELGPRHPGELTIVFMGMGEPLHNARQLKQALAILQHPAGLGLSPRRITVSTAGLVPKIDELAGWEGRPLLAVSLNAVDDEQRRELMPIARRHSLLDLRAALERFPVRARERITIEYVLLAGVNDQPEHAVALADYCATFPHHINLIPYNPPARATPGRASFSTPSERRIDAFVRAVLSRRPALLSVRRSRGRDISAACGQLVSVQGLGAARGARCSA